MIEFLTEPFTYGITQRALVAVTLLAVMCGPLGVWAIHFRLGYAAESLSHAILPGLVVAALLSVSVYAGAAAGIALAAVVIWLAGRPRRANTDIAVAVAVTGLLAAGVILALAPDVPAHLPELLFGELLAVSAGDLAATAVLAGFVLAALLWLHRRFTLAAFEPVTARVAGVRTGAIGLGALLLVAVAVVASARILGNLLAVTLLILPAIAAGRFAVRLPAQLVLAAGIGVVSGFGGLVLSYHAGTAAAASVTLVAAVILLVSMAAGVRRPDRPRFGSPIEALRD